MFFDLANAGDQPALGDHADHGQDDRQHDEEHSRVTKAAARRELPSSKSGSSPGTSTPGGRSIGKAGRFTSSTVSYSQENV